MNEALKCFIKGLENTYRENENHYHSLVRRFILCYLHIKDGKVNECYEEIEDTFNWLKNEVRYPIDDLYNW